MTKRKSAGILTAVILAVAAFPAHAWGPVTQVSITSAAAHVVSQDGTIPIVRLQSYIRQGASIPDSLEQRIFPQSDIDPLSAIQREMYLLQGVRTDRIDPYFAYRLGALGKLIVQYVAPLSSGNPSIRAQYYADVEKSIQGVKLNNTARNIVDPRAYFAVLTRQSWGQDTTIAVDYQSGLGFNGVARSGLSGAATLAVDAVADVWFTIFRSQVTLADVSRSDIRRYVLDAFRFYLDQGMLNEVDDLYARSLRKGLFDQDAHKELGDLLFAEEHFERAIEQYDIVLKANPDRRDVTVRIANYYVSVGDNEMQRGKLEQARDAYKEAADLDPLHPDAQRKYIKTQSLITKRDERKAGQQLRIANARQMATQAESAALERNYARAIGLLREAEQNYQGVTDEFPAEFSRAESGLRNVRMVLRDMKKGLIENAQTLSGSGFSRDVRAIANLPIGVEDDALRSLLESEYQGAVRTLEQQLTGR
jgi:tetratricopeptide (TPR) repeat protein